MRTSEPCGSCAAVALESSLRVIEAEVLPLADVAKEQAQGGAPPHRTLATPPTASGRPPGAARTSHGYDDADAGREDVEKSRASLPNVAF